MTSTGITWFPQQYAHLFFEIKGGLAVIAVILVVVHMNRCWQRVIKNGTKGQQWRYHSLLAFAAWTAASTVEQVQVNAPVQYYNLGVLVTVSMTIIAMVISLWEDKT